MAIMRIHKSKNYSIVSNLLLDNTVLSEGATLLLLRMLRKPDDWKFSVQKLAEEYSLNKNKISRYFSELKEHKFLQIQQIKTSKCFEYTYHIYEIPSDCYYDEEGRIRQRDTKKEVVLNRYVTSLQTDRTSHACAILGKYFSRHDGFLGTAQELIDDLPEEVQGEFTAKTLGKTLRAIEYSLEKNYDFIVEFKKTKHARLISVHYTDEESPFTMAEVLGDITDPQNEGTVLSPQNQRVTSPIPKTGIPETGSIIITELNNNKHKEVSDGWEKVSDVSWTSSMALDPYTPLTWEDCDDRVCSYLSDCPQIVYRIQPLDASDRTKKEQSMTMYAGYTEEDFQNMEAFYHTHSEMEEDLESQLEMGEDISLNDDCLFKRLPMILRDAKHNPFVDLTTEDIAQLHQENLLFQKQKEEDSLSMTNEEKRMSLPVEQSERCMSNQSEEVQEPNPIVFSPKEEQPTLSHTQEEENSSISVKHQEGLGIVYPETSVSKTERPCISSAGKETIQPLCADLITNTTWNPAVTEGLSPLFTLRMRFQHNRGSPSI